MARAAATRADLPEDLRGPLKGDGDETVNIASFPYGCHVCEIEVDPETGEAEIVRYNAVDDCGRAINPLIVHGQIHGGIVQGVGQALWEQIVYDRDTAQLLTGSFMDYAMPRADLLPFFNTELSEVPCTTHPLGHAPGRRRRHDPGAWASSSTRSSMRSPSSASPMSRCRPRRSGSGARFRMHSGAAMRTRETELLFSRVRLCLCG